MLQLFNFLPVDLRHIRRRRRGVVGAAARPSSISCLRASSSSSP
jgi:hypothetical protein